MEGKNTIESKPEIEMANVRERMERLLAVYNGVDAIKTANAMGGKKS